MTEQARQLTPEEFKDAFVREYEAAHPPVVTPPHIAELLVLLDSKQMRLAQLTDEQRQTICDIVAGEEAYRAARDAALREAFTEAFGRWDEEEPPPPDTDAWPYTA